MELDGDAGVPGLAQSGAGHHPRVVPLGVVRNHDAVETGQLGSKDRLVEEVETVPTFGHGADVPAVAAYRQLPQELGHDVTFRSDASSSRAWASGSGAAHDARSKSVARKPCV